MNARLLSLAVLASLGALAAPGWAKDKPAPDWAVEAAKIPTPVFVKDASAVLLSDEYLITVDTQNNAVERERWAIRILKPQGRGRAHCSIGYDVDQKLNYFRAWTIKADGAQIQAQDSDFSDHGGANSAVLLFTERTRTLNPPANDPGSVVVCETEEQLRPYVHEEDWDFQHSIPVVSEALEIDLPPGVAHAESWRKFTPVAPLQPEPNHLRWEIKEVPALNLEDIHATPAWSALSARMAVKWGELAVQGTENQWRAIGQWQDKLEEHRPDPTPEIAAKAQELVAGAPDLYTKLSHITDFIQKNVRYFVIESGIGGWQAHPAAEIYRNRYGDCKDKTTILISMLQAVGIRAHYLHVDSRRGVIDPTFPSLYGNHMITAIELPDSDHDSRLMARVKAANGKTLLVFDPTDEETPVGLIRGALQGAYANLANGVESQVLLMPVLPPDSGGRIRKGTFTLSTDGLLAGDVAITFNNNNASSERSALKRNDAKRFRENLKKSLGAELSGLDFKGYEVHQPDELDKPVSLDLHFNAANYARPAGTLLLVRPRVMGTHAEAVPELMQGKPRLYPIELGHPGRWFDSFDITLPDGYLVDETPDPVSIQTDFASYHSSVTATGNLLHYEAEFILRQPEIPPTQAPSFRKLENTIMLSERGTAVLKKQ